MQASPDGHRDGSIQADGLRLHYVEWGDPTHPPFVLLHGLQDCARSWDRLATALSPGYRVIAPDVRGHGDSQWAPSGPYRFAENLADLEALVERLSLGVLMLLGHGSGGAAAVAYAARHPDITDALIVADSDLNASGPGSQRGPDGPAGSLEEVVEHLRTLQPNATDATLVHQASHLTREAPGGRRVWKRDPSAVAGYEQPSLGKEWRGLRCPVLLVRGRQTDVLSHDAAVKMREALSRARLGELEGGGHWLHQEFPGAFESAVRWFLDNVPA